MESYAAGLARPDRWTRGRPAGQRAPWHAVEAHRPPTELDGEVELALCGAIVHVEGGRRWDHVGAGPAGCAECRRLSGLTRSVEAGPAQFSRAR
ncbi:hypothetical protein [Geodermatophilus sp. SYSU D00710]